MNVTEIYEVLPQSDLKLPGFIEAEIKKIEAAKSYIILAATGEFTSDNPEFAMEPLKDLTMLQDKLENLKSDIEKLRSKIGIPQK
jgi:hypothetical protein